MHSRHNQLKISLQQVPSRDMLRESMRGSQILSPMSPSRDRSRQLFITQRNIDSNFQQIEKHHQELNKYIDALEVKVNQRMEKNEAQILNAYKNHFNLVKKDMDEMKKHTQAQASNQNNYVQTIQYLEKKLAIFRDESLKLFDKLDQKQKQLEEFKAHAQQIINENSYMTESVKLLTKKNKQLQTELAMLKKKQEQSMNQLDDFTNKYDVSLMRAASQRNKTYRHKNRTTLTSAHHSKAVNNQMNTIIPKNYETYNTHADKQDGPSCGLFIKKLRVRLGYIGEQVLQQVVRVAEDVYNEMYRRSHSRNESFENAKSRLERATKISMRSKSNYTVDYSNDLQEAPLRSQVNRQQFLKQRQSYKYNVKQQMSCYFVKCIETIKKDITRKKQISSMNFYKQGHPISFEQFKKLDCYRLMELALSNQKILDGLYNLLLNEEK